MAKSSFCCLCGWEITSGKVFDPKPANLDEGAVCCAWCAEHRVKRCKDAIAAILDEMSAVTVAEGNKIKAEKLAMN